MGNCQFTTERSLICQNQRVQQPQSHRNLAWKLMIWRGSFTAKNYLREKFMEICACMRKKKERKKSIWPNMNAKKQSQFLNKFKLCQPMPTFCSLHLPHRALHFNGFPSITYYTYKQICSHINFSINLSQYATYLYCMYDAQMFQLY